MTASDERGLVALQATIMMTAADCLQAIRESELGLKHFIIIGLGGWSGTSLAAHGGTLPVPRLAVTRLMTQ